MAKAQVDLSPGVARISLIHGDVSTQRGDTGDWSAAALNQPIVAGDHVSTGDRSRAEVQLDHANILRLGDSSQAKIATLTRTQIQVQVGQGLADYSVFKESEAEVEIDTPNVAIRPTSKEGVYRIEVSDGQTQVTVRKGSAEISTPQGSTRVEKGHSAIVRGTAEDAEYKVAEAPSKDSWDSWNSERDSVIRNAQSWSHTNRYYAGSEDLDAYGHWVDVPGYGYAWAPVVAVGWAPYRQGRWVWEPYWGWTWVSYEPWGWAPYHYGRWFLNGGSWMWWPGPVIPAYRPIWAPAYVSFFGFGGGHWGVSVGFGFGSVGWLPIGPGDRFFPWWGGYRSRFNQVNVTNITNVRNVGGIAPLHGGTQFSNLRLVAANHDMARQGISTVPANQFGTGRTAPTPIGQDGFHDAHMLTGNLPIVPTRETASASNRPASPSTLHDAGQQRFFTKSPSAAAAQPFEKQAAQVQTAIQRNGRFTPIQAGEQNNTIASNTMASNTMASREAGGGMARTLNRSEAQPGRTAEPSRNTVGTSSSADGWRRFGAQEAQNRSTDGLGQRAGNTPSVSSGPRSDAQTQGRNATPTASPDHSGWRKFSDSNAGPNGNRAATQNGLRNSRRPDAMSTPQSQNGAAVNSRRWEGTGTPQSSPGTSETPSRGSQGSASWNRSMGGEVRTPQSYSQGYSRAERQPMYGNTPQSSRPPLELRRPIVTPRSGGGYGGGSGRGNAGGGRSESRGSGSTSRGGGPRR